MDRILAMARIGAIRGKHDEDDNEVTGISYITDEVRGVLRTFLLFSKVTEWSKELGEKLTDFMLVNITVYLSSLWMGQDLRYACTTSLQITEGLQVLLRWICEKHVDTWIQDQYPSSVVFLCLCSSFTDLRCSSGSLCCFEWWYWRCLCWPLLLCVWVSKVPSSPNVNSYSIVAVFKWNSFSKHWECLS